MSTRALLLGLVLAVTSGACGPSDPCEALLVEICEGHDDAYCGQAREFLDGRLVDDDGAALAPDARTQMCAAINRTVELRKAYVFKARQVITGEPQLILTKSARDARLEALQGELGKEPDAKVRVEKLARITGEEGDGDDDEEKDQSE